MCFALNLFLYTVLYGNKSPDSLSVWYYSMMKAYTDQHIVYQQCIVAERFVAIDYERRKIPTGSYDLAYTEMNDFEVFVLVSTVTLTLERRSGRGPL